MTECLVKINKKYIKVFSSDDEKAKFKDSFLAFCTFKRPVNIKDFLKNPAIHLDDDEYFYIDFERLEDEKIKNDIALLREGFKSSASLDSLDSKDFSKAKLLLFSEDGDGINAQSLTPRKHLHYKAVISFNLKKETRVEENLNLLLCENYTNFCLDKERIYFKKMSDIVKLSDNFTVLYKEASKEEVEKIFTDLQEVVSFDFDLLDKKRIDSNSYKKLNLLLKDGIFSKIKEYKDDFLHYVKGSGNIKFLKDSRFKIKDKESLKEFLRFASEDYYDGPYTGRKKRSTSSENL